MTALEIFENERLALQYQLDSKKEHSERNRLGQFATPTGLALEILAYSKQLVEPSRKIRFLDPAFGTGSFYSALKRTFPEKNIQDACGFEIDDHYGISARELWKTSRLHLQLTDFTRQKPPNGEGKANLLICNPPYVRHHHLQFNDKIRLHQRVAELTGLRLSGLAGLYCYFMCLSHAWMSTNALAAWLVPSEFMDVNYGEEIKKYLLTKVTLLRIHRFDPSDMQFGDALVSSAVVWFRNTVPPPSHEVEFSYGGSHQAPRTRRRVRTQDLAHTSKWTRVPFKGAGTQRAFDVVRVRDMFIVKRGIATGANKFFVLNEDKIREFKIPAACLRPILPSPRYLRTDEVRADTKGNPIISPKLALISCNLAENEVREKFPSVWTYFERGKASEISKHYLCAHRRPWYAQEDRRPAPIVCTYMGRGEHKRPFRFILNHSKAIAANVYLMLYPTPVFEALLTRNPNLLNNVWQALNAIPADTLLAEGRVYGGGLYKMEPRELANAEIQGLDRSVLGLLRQTELSSA